MEHRDSPGDEPGADEGPRTATARRFARLVSSPASRRLAPARLVAAGALAVAAGTLAVVGAGMLVRSAARWVDARPEHQIRFDQIELDPPPDPWVKDGKALILAGVRDEAKLGESLGLLDLDLAKLETDFRRNPWVKDVLRIDRSHHGRLIVSLSYRKPVAVVPFPRFEPGAFVLDDEGVVLPDKQIAWTSTRDPFRVRGMACPLIILRDAPESSPAPRVGLPWKRKVEGDATDDADPLILRAARLARFLQERKLALKSPAEVPDFASIHPPDKADGPFFLFDSAGNLVCWGKAPGDEKPGEPTGEARWEMLRKWVRDRGPLVARYPDYLGFTLDGPVLKTGNGPGRR